MRPDPRLSEVSPEWLHDAKDLATALLALAEENERIEKLYDAAITTCQDSLAQFAEENERLREALHRAGDRLMQVQPAIDTDCAWALGIVPQAQDEIAAALQTPDEAGEG